MTPCHALIRYSRVRYWSALFSGCGRVEGVSLGDPFAPIRYVLEGHTPPKCGDCTAWLPLQDLALMLVLIVRVSIFIGGTDWHTEILDALC